MPVAGVLSGALVWGLIWYPYRALQDVGVSGAMATLITYLLAMLFGTFMLPRVGANCACRIKTGPDVGGGAAVERGLTNFGYVLAVLHGEVMRVLLFYLAPLWTVLFSYTPANAQSLRLLIIALSFGAFIMLWSRARLPLPNNHEWPACRGHGFRAVNVVSRRAAHLSVEAKSYSVWLGTAC
jgi:hypothetical protein